MKSTNQGLVIRAQSGFYTVHEASGDTICRLRGKLKRERPEEDIAAVGDWVNYSQSGDGSGAIESVEPRKKSLARSLSGVRFAYRQILLANPAQAVRVFSFARPRPH